MSKYVSVPRADWDWQRFGPTIGLPTVFPSEPVKIGLKDAAGVDIYRMPDPVGFLRFKEDD